MLAIVSSRMVVARGRHLAVAAIDVTSQFERVTTQMKTCPSSSYQCYCYSTTSVVMKKKKRFGSIHSDLSDDEIRKIVQEEEAAMLAKEEAKFLVSEEDWEPGMRKRKLIMARDEQDLIREAMPDQFQPKWTLRDKRCGALALKVGMMPVFDQVWGRRYPCTVLHLDQNIVLGHKTKERNGYMAIQVAAGQRKRKNVGKSVLGQYQTISQYNNTDENDNTSLPPYVVREFRITSPNHYIPIGSPIHARHFVPGQQVDVSGISKGKGFQGGIKRHGFAGMPATHGTSKSHRSIGSTGQCQDPGKVFKGKKMPGRMGTDRVTVQNLQIVKIDRSRNLIFVHGAVPGNKGAFVEIRDAVKRPLWDTEHVLDALERPPLPTFDYDPTIDGRLEETTAVEEFMPIENDDPMHPDYRNTLVKLKEDA